MRLSHLLRDSWVIVDISALAGPALLLASVGIYWSGRDARARGAFFGGRLLTLVGVLVVWQWLWLSIPDGAFPSRLWKQVSFVPAGVGLACWIAIEARRFVASRRASP